MPTIPAKPLHLARNCFFLARLWNLSVFMVEFYQRWWTNDDLLALNVSAYAQQMSSRWLRWPPTKPAQLLLLQEPRIVRAVKVAALHALPIPCLSESICVTSPHALWVSGAAQSLRVSEELWRSTCPTGCRHDSCAMVEVSLSERSRELRRCVHL